MFCFKKAVLNTLIVKKIYLKHARSVALSVKREPSQPIIGKLPKYVTAKEAVSVIKSGDTVWLQAVSGAPKALADGLLQHGVENNLRNVNVFHLLSLINSEYVKPEYKDIFRVKAIFVGSLDREAVNSGRADYLPVFLSEVPLLVRRGIHKVTVCMLQVTPPDEHGYLSMGVTVIAMREILRHADIVIGEVNSKQPRTLGDTFVHQSHFDYLVESDMDLEESNPAAIGEVEKAIGKNIAENLVENGATLQLGIGEIPDAVLAECKLHKDLGIHTEMFSDGVIDLLENGNINNKMKKTDNGLMCATFILGSRKFYKYFDNNPLLVMKPCDYTNHPDVISLNPKVTAINSCIEIDLSGQIASDTLGSKVFSGYGGQVDFFRGAALGQDGKGKAILAFRSTTKKGESKIVPFLKGAAVTTTRAHTNYVVTEYGVAALFGKSYRQRAYELIQIAHPEHRASLEKAAFERLKCMPSKD